MRGTDHQRSAMFSYISAERRVPRDHPPRAIRAMADAALKELGPSFERIYAAGGRPSIAPEKLLRALLLQALYTVRGERMLMEQLDYNFLFRWFVGLSIDDPVWDATVFTKNRERLLDGGIADGFFTAVVGQARAQDLLSDEHFTVDGTLIEAWAGHKSFKRKDDGQHPPPDDPGNSGVDFHGERRTNATHRSTTDPEARLCKKSKGSGAMLGYAGHVLMENRNGLAVNGRVTQAGGRAEPQAALAMVARSPGWRRVTLGADKGYDRGEFVRELRDRRVTPHIARKPTSVIDDRTMRHPGYAVSQQKRKRVEEIFGWLKTVGGLRKTRHRGAARVGWMFSFALAAYNLVRMRKLLPAPG
ncbi:MAG: IS5 family transposase [Candidatus Binataceae bacterium]|nr:IS5 family transposase [Candidatus Binataceae bacterium]